MSRKLLLILCCFVIISGCAAVSSGLLDQLYGPSEPRDRQVTHNSTWGERYTSNIQPIIEQRCTVCHGCYDAPCQLNTASTTGLERGASKALVYDGLRLTESIPSRLFVDHHTLDEWREAGFYPAINERVQTPAANLEGSLLYKTLELKRLQAPITEGLLPSDISIDIARKNSCPKIEEFETYKQQHPNWGMPYGLPALSEAEFSKIAYWLAKGAPMPSEPQLSDDLQHQVTEWEAFFNQHSLKGQLVNRYIYEHLFLANLYFDETSTDTFFKLVRSFTPPGEPIEVIPSRRPYDSPETDRFYYRLQKVTSSRLAKTHMPYALNTQRMDKWHEWFFNDDYQVTSLPSYKAEVAGNPFIAFEQLPIQSRYRFMLEEAEFTIMGFIKGPVCRGQVALNVINDRFWVFFADPDLVDPERASQFLAEQSQHLRLPTEAGSTLMPLTNWMKYSSSHKSYLQAQYEMQKYFFEEQNAPLTEAIIWNGDGHNDNAALTVFRHVDSASVVKGLVGDSPQTAWVVTYPILERIHYLLVAGFDVFGNVGHQLITRLYMDFLRMESEMNFLTLLPPDVQKTEWQNWYRDASSKVLEFVEQSSLEFYEASHIDYQTDNPKAELLQRIRQRLEPVVATHHDLENSELDAEAIQALKQLGSVTGIPASLLPQVVFLSVEDRNGQQHLFTALHNNAHTNITSLLNEESNRLPEEDSVTIVKGLIGAYPSAFWHVKEDQLHLLARDTAQLADEQDYQHLMARYGIRRTNPDFWAHSDAIHALAQEQQPLKYGLFDYNRLENR